MAKSRRSSDAAWLQDPQGTAVSEGSELSAVVTEIADVTAGPEEGSIALAKRVYAHLYEGNLSSRYNGSLTMPTAQDLHICSRAITKTGQLLVYVSLQTVSAIRRVCVIHVYSPLTP